MDDLFQAAMLHDLGKLRQPDAYKPEKLTDEEYLHISDDGKPDRGVVAIVARNLNTC